MSRPKTSLGLLGARVAETLADITVEEYYGLASLKEHCGARHMHWVSPGGTLVPPAQAGAREVPANATQRKPACVTLEAEVQCHIFAESDEALERLLRNVLAALALGGIRYKSGRYRVPTQEDAEVAGITLRSEWMILTFTVNWPVIEEIQPLREVLSTLQTSGVIQADGSVNPQ